MVQCWREVHEEDSCCFRRRPMHPRKQTSQELCIDGNVAGDEVLDADGDVGEGEGEDEV